MKKIAILSAAVLLVPLCLSAYSDDRAYSNEEGDYNDDDRYSDYRDDDSYPESGDQYRYPGYGDRDDYRYSVPQNTGRLNTRDFNRGQDPLRGRMQSIPSGGMNDSSYNSHQNGEKQPLTYHEYIEYLELIAYDGQTPRNGYSNDMQRNTNKEQWSSERGSNNNQTSDSDLKKAIQDKLAKGWFQKGYENVQVSVSNGNVMLSGFVDSDSDLKEVEKRVQKVDGIKKIANNIRIANQGTMQKNNKERASSY